MNIARARRGRAERRCNVAWLVLGVLFLLCMVTLMFGAFNLEARKPDPRSRPGARWPVARLRPASPRVSVNASRRTAMSAITSRRPAEVVGVSVRPATRVNAGRLASNAAIPAGTVARPAPAVALATPTPYAASAAGAAKTARFCPTFRVGRRHDFQLTMAPIFVELGLCPTESPAFDVFWGLTLNEPKAFSSPLLARRGIPADAIFNSVPRMMQTVGVKPSIASLQYDCEIHVLSAALRSGPLSAPGWCAFTQRGFNARREEKLSAVRLDYGRLRAYSKERERATGTFPSVWILKSIVAFAQRGIQLVLLRKEDVTSDRALATWAELHMPRGDFTLQEYLREPMLWQDRKFDMRALALVTSVEPLRFYVLDHAFPKIASQAYTLDLAALKDECVHFKMPVCAGTSVDPYPRSTDAPRFRDHLVPPLADATDWDRRLYPKLYTALLRVILVARRHLLPAEQSLVRKGFAQKRVQVLQPDVLFDKQGHAWIVEMNTNGFMVGSLHKEFFDATPQMRSAVEIAGVNRYPLRAAYGSESAQLLEAHCRLPNWQQTAASRELVSHGIPVGPVQCAAPVRAGGVSERAAISQMVDEWCHTGRWLPIWPPRDSATYAHVRPFYADVARPQLRARYWTHADGVLLRFARWLRLDAPAAALAFCDAAHQRSIENRTIRTPGCTCEATGRPPSVVDLPRVLEAQRKHAERAKKGRDDFLADEGSNVQVLTRVPRLDKAQFPPGYRGRPYDARYDNGKATAGFEEYHHLDAGSSSKGG